MDSNYTHVKTLPPAPRTVRGKPCHMSLHPNGTKLLYCNGSCVFIRDVSDPTDCDVYSQHSKDTTAAVYSPNGNFIASGDTSGKIRIWDAINKEHVLKYEYELLAGPVRDISWSEDNQRLAVCGEGRGQTAKVIMVDSGNTVGNLNGATRACGTIAYSPKKPFGIVLGSEDFTTYFFQGPPFKMNAQYHEHGNFVNCIQYAPDGMKFVTGGADCRMFVHDAEKGILISELSEMTGRIHKGGVYGCSWSPDSKHLLTCSADKTCKIWVMDEKYYASNKEAVVFTMGTELGDMQLNCLWAGTTLLSLSLNGNINYLDADNPTKPKRVVQGHIKSIVTSCLSSDKSFLFTASFDGLVFQWNLQTHEGVMVTGAGHTNQVQNMCRSGDMIVTCGMDDTVRWISVKEKKYVEGKVIKLQAQPQQIAAGENNLFVVACTDGHLVVIKDEKVVQILKMKYEPTSVDVCSALGKVAVGTKNSKVLIFDLNIQGENVVLNASDIVPTNGDVTDIKFSPDKTLLGMCTGKKQVKVVETTNYDMEKINQASHAVRVNAIAWTPNSRHITSAGVDGAVFTYSVETGEKVVTMHGAHARSIDVTTLQWKSDNELMTMGRQDCCTRIWKINSFE